MVTIKLLAVLKKYAPDDGCLELAYAPGMTVADALGASEIAKATVKYSIMVNNARKKPEDTLEDGDTIIVMPLLAGG